MGVGPAIQTDALRKQFGSFVAVNGVTFDVEQGLTFGMLGPNGAGKSTLIRMLTTLLEPSGGTARVAGCDIRKDPDGVRRAIGVIPQALTSDPDLTAAENLEFYARLYGLSRTARAALIDELLASVDLLDWRNEYVGRFSGGMRRRLEIARGLVHQPPILFLDEPTTGLDPASRIAIWQMIRRLQARIGLTIFLTTHYMEEADQLCDRVAIFDHGRIVAFDTPANLKAGLPETPVLEVRFEASPPGWADDIAGIPGVLGVETVDGAFLVRCGDRMRVTEEIIELARRRGVRIASLVVGGRTLDDVFIRFTGTDLRDSADSGRPMDVRHLYERRVS